MEDVESSFLNSAISSPTLLVNEGVPYRPSYITFKARSLVTFDSLLLRCHFGSGEYPHGFLLVRARLADRVDAYLAHIYALGD